MEPSDSVLALGIAISQDQSNSYDVTARWMACYIAEMIQAVETAQGENKADLQSKCYETILKLWHHKSFYPDDSLPFRDYDSIFKTLNRIDPSEDVPFYVNRGKTITEKNEEVQTYINIALVIDKVVKIWFEHILNQAIQAATGDAAISYLKAVLNLEEDDFDYITINTILRGLANEETPLNSKNAVNKKIIEEKIETLKTFNSFSQELLADLEEQLLKTQDE